MPLIVFLPLRLIINKLSRHKASNIKLIPLNENLVCCMNIRRRQHIMRVWRLLMEFILNIVYLLKYFI